ncbi:MAG TPA: UDP-N-acetylmuramate dehydrogenase [Spirochaetia bacterium]|nr:UDP-N-acetylmuramate dehydrogenase [Spirochaetia bacterium]
MFKVVAAARLDEPMAPHTSFRIGGPADLFVAPSSPAEAEEVLAVCARESVPVFLLGGGTNLLVADRGIRGAVVDLSRLAGISVQDDVLTAQAGTPVSDVSEAACAHGLSGLEFAYSLPGSVGGAVWMNARCYDSEISDVLEQVDYLDLATLQRHRYVVKREDWAYKTSPFQDRGRLVLSASVRLKPGDPRRMRGEMQSHREDRERKGHFRYPCAGSLFKNNRAFGAPTGQLIDSLGLKGARVGDAQVAPYHGNIFINVGAARASDMRALIEQVEAAVRDRLGFQLEREVILAGDWD